MELNDIKKEIRRLRDNRRYEIDQRVLMSMLFILADTVETLTEKVKELEHRTLLLSIF